MPRDGDGQYDLVYDWNDDKINGIKVLASRMQAQDQDIATALTGSLASDGQTSLTGNLDFNNNKAVDLADGINAQDGVNVSQVQTGEIQYYGITTTTPLGTDGLNYDLGPSPTFTVYPTYARFSLDCHYTCIDDPVLRFGELATKTLVKSDGVNGYTALVAGDMVADKEYICSYNEDNSSTRIVIENPEIPIFDVNGLTKSTTTTYGVSALPSTLFISNNSTDANNDIDISAGNIVSSDGSTQIVVSALTKQLNTTWVAGTNQGGLDTGTKAVSTWYYTYAIYNPTDNIADILFSASPTSPTLPTGYTKSRRIKNGFFKTDGSGNIIPFNQYESGWVLGSGVTATQQRLVSTTSQTGSTGTLSGAFPAVAVEATMSISMEITGNNICTFTVWGNAQPTPTGANPPAIGLVRGTSICNHNDFDATGVGIAYADNGVLSYRNWDFAGGVGRIQVALISIKEL